MTARSISDCTAERADSATVRKDSRVIESAGGTRSILYNVYSIPPLLFKVFSSAPFQPLVRLEKKTEQGGRKRNVQVEEAKKLMSPHSKAAILIG
jgi:hypothetical protein